jgi:hypothetical protein
MSRVPCTYHCAACDGHFHSEAAFVTQWQGEGRTCIEPLDDDRFMALSHDAKCELQRVEYTPVEPGNRQVYPAGWKPGDPPMQRVVEPVTVWTLRAGVEAARDRFALKGSPQMASTSRTDPDPGKAPTAAERRPPFRQDLCSGGGAWAPWPRCPEQRRRAPSA